MTMRNIHTFEFAEIAPFKEQVDYLSQVKRHVCKPSVRIDKKLKNLSS